MLDNVPETEGFITASHRYEEDQMLAQRVMKAAQVREVDSKATADLATTKDRQRVLETLKGQALATIQREPELVAPSEVQFLAHALVVPSTDPEDRGRRDDEVEKKRSQDSVGVRTRKEMGRATYRLRRSQERATAAGVSGRGSLDVARAAHVTAIPEALIARS